MADFNRTLRPDLFDRIGETVIVTSSRSAIPSAFWLTDVWDEPTGVQVKVFSVRRRTFRRMTAGAFDASFQTADLSRD